MRHIRGRYYSAYGEEIWKCTYSDNKNGEYFHIVHPEWDRGYPIKEKNGLGLTPMLLSLDALINNYQPKPHTPLIAEFVRGALKQLAKDLKAN